MGLRGGAKALFTSRAHGNLSSVGGEHAEGGLAARERLRVALGLERLARGYQVHGTVVCRVLPNRSSRALRPDSEVQPDFEADGHAVAARGVAAMVLAADCVPVVLGGGGAVAALHAGWRGLSGGHPGGGGASSAGAGREGGARGDRGALRGGVLL